MAIVPNPQSELLREPNLLVPGKKPTGSVKVDWTNPNSNGLLHWWPMLEGVGQTVHDYARYKNGEFVNDPQWLTPHPSMPTGISFTKSNSDSISIPNFITPHRGTISLWIYSVSDIDFRPIGSHDAYECKFDAGAHTIQHQFFGAGGTYLSSGSDVWSADQWVHVVFTYDYISTVTEIYVDGIFKVSGTTADDDPGDGTLSLGHRTGHGEYLDGYMDNVMIYSRVLRATEIYEFYLDPYAALIPA